MTIRRLRFSRPAEPVSYLLKEALRQLCESVPGIAEAWLPECSINGEPAQLVLVVGLVDGYRRKSAMQELMPKLRLLLHPQRFLDVLPFALADLPADARIPQCRVFEAKPKPWWKGLLSRRGTPS